MHVSNLLVPFKSVVICIDDVHKVTMYIRTLVREPLDSSVVLPHTRMMATRGDGNSFDLGFEYRNAQGNIV